MPYLQHASRHVSKTVIDHITAYLGAQGWLSTPTMFGTPPFSIQTRRLRESELLTLTSNTLGIFFGEESSDEAEELGGGLMQVRSQLYVDVISEKYAHGLAICQDIKDLLSGRAPGTSRFLVVRDYTSAPAGVPTPDHQVEFLQIERQRPENSEAKLSWQTLTATMELIFPGEDS